MKTKAQRRQEFAFATWKNANRQNPYRPVLYDAGDLGYCVLTWRGYSWHNQWFDKAEKLEVQA